ncbi:hypothetical protein J3F83DRAFT_407082 [Trichoderma novae-zelandiae]
MLCSSPPCPAVLRLVTFRLSSARALIVPVIASVLVRRGWKPTRQHPHPQTPDPEHRREPDPEPEAAPQARRNTAERQQLQASPRPGSERRETQIIAVWSRQSIHTLPCLASAGLVIRTPLPAAVSGPSFSGYRSPLRPFCRSLYSSHLISCHVAAPSLAPLLFAPPPRPGDQLGSIAPFSCVSALPIQLNSIRFPSQLFQLAITAVLVAVELEPKGIQEGGQDRGPGLFTRALASSLLASRGGRPFIPGSRQSTKPQRALEPRNTCR